MDGVNIAARLEGVAAPSGVCISAKILDEVRGKIDANFEDVGDQKLKNIGLPVRAYRLSIDASIKTSRPFLALPDKPRSPCCPSPI